MSAAVVVTGIGVTAPNGLNTDAYWSATLRGESGIGRVTRFDPTQYPSRLAGEVPDFNPRDYLSGRLVAQTDHMTRLALMASDAALADAKVDADELPEYGMGVVTASSSGGFEFGHRELQKLWSQGAGHVSAYQSFAWFYAVNSGQISIRHGIRGPSGVLVADQAGGLDAIGHARRQVRKGIQLMVTGGTDSSLCPWGWVGLVASGRLSTQDDPERAYLPFDTRADGHVPGEGGAILILESEESARQRGVGRPYGEIAGYAATFDPSLRSGREPGLRRAMELALADAGMVSGDIDVVFADAAGTPELDQIEAQAIGKVFAGRFARVPVTAPKTMTGRLYSGGPPLDLAAALLSIRDDVIPPTVNVSRIAPHFDLDLVVGTARNTSVNAAMVLARGYGGFNSAMVVRATETTTMPASNRTESKQ